MLKYCYTDTSLTMKVDKHLKDEGKKFSSKSYELERSVRSIIDKQQDNGFAFDLAGGMILDYIVVI